MGLLGWLEQPTKSCSKPPSSCSTPWGASVMGSILRVRLRLSGAVRVGGLWVHTSSIVGGISGIAGWPLLVIEAAAVRQSGLVGWRRGSEWPKMLGTTRI